MVTPIAVLFLMPFHRKPFATILNSKDFIKIDTIPQAFVRWNSSVPDSIINLKEKAMQLWLQKELQLDTIFIKREK